MKKLLIAIILVSSFFWGCKTEKIANSKGEYLRWVGDIVKNDQIDDPNFTVCNGDENILQYFNLDKGPVYPGEKSTVMNTFLSNYKPIKGENEDGLIRIRFIVNCEGKAGRFRVIQAGYDYQEKEFDKKIISQLLTITKEIPKWEILHDEQKPVDYYMYLIFKMTDGHLTEILP